MDKNLFPELKALFSSCPCYDPSQLPGARAGHASVRTGGSRSDPWEKQVGVAEAEGRGPESLPHCPPGTQDLQPMGLPTGLGRSKIAANF